MREIMQEGAKVLRATAKPVPQKAFKDGEVAKLVKDMAEALEQEPDGVALAAPQVGVSWRLFIVRMDRVDIPPLNLSPGDGPGGHPASPDTLATARPAVVEVYINPEILKTSRRRQRADEGCLSVRGLYGTTSRHEHVTIKAQKENGFAFTRGAGGLLAQVFEHEMDHLKGVLFIDTAEDVVEIKPNELHEQPAA